MRKSPTGCYVLYHAGCVDGFCAAFCAWLALGDDPTYAPVQYGEPFPADIPDGSIVYVLDFSYDRATLLHLSRVMQKLVCLDHHETSREFLAEVPGCLWVADKSGARLAYEHFLGYPGFEYAPARWASNATSESPQLGYLMSIQLECLVNYVQDRDLWRWQLPDSRAVSAALWVLPFEFATWHQLLRNGLSALTLEGRAILSYQDKQVAQIAKYAVRRMIAIDTMSRPVDVVNTSCLLSEVGDYILRKDPKRAGCGLVLLWYEKYDQRQQRPVVICTLRSDPSVDCSLIARYFGGGGHKQAAGFSLPNVGYLAKSTIRREVDFEVIA